MGTEKETIDQFAGWENPSQQHDFFGETNLQDNVDVVTQALEDDATLTPEEKEKAKAQPKPVDEQKIIDEQFKSFETPSNEVEEEEEEDEDVDNPGQEGKAQKASNNGTVNSKSTLAFLSEKGFINFEAEEGKELTEEEAANVLEDSWENSIEEGIEDSIKGLPAEIQDLIRVASKNGDYKTLMQKMASGSNSGFDATSDIETEEVQILAITEDLRNQGYDAEEIETQIEFLKEKDKLATMGKKAFDKLVAKKEQDRKAYVKQVADQKETVKKNARDYKANLITHISAIDEVKGLTLNKKDKETLPSYISDPTVQLQDGRVISELQADLFKVMADKDQIVLLAKVLKSGFDFSSLERKAVTTEARNLKGNIQNQKDVTGTLASSSPSKKAQKKAVWDYLDD